MEDLLNLKEQQCIMINKQKYRVTSTMKFTEGSSYWMEYKIEGEDYKEYYLNVEIGGLVTLSWMIYEKIKPAMNIQYNGRVYELFQKGNAKIENCTGWADVLPLDAVEYYEYKSQQSENEILTIEVWRNELEVSEGKVIDQREIKVLKES